MTNSDLDILFNKLKDIDVKTVNIKTNLKRSDIKSLKEKDIDKKNDQQSKEYLDQKQSYEIDRMSKDIEGMSLKIKNIQSIKDYTQNLTSIYLFVILYIFVINPFSFKYSDSVINVLLTTTTVTIVGLYAIVVRGVFEVKDSKDEKK